MRITVLLLCALLLSSCFRYRKTNFRHHFVRSNYLKNERIIVKDAIICSNLGSLFFNESIEINRDSVLEVFVNAFQKLPANFELKHGKANCDRNFIHNRRVKYRRINFSTLFSLVGDETNTVLIPIINYYYIWRRNTYITSSGAVGGDGFSKNVYIDLAILIFRNKELTYFSSRFFFTRSETVYDYRESIDFSIKQENIDTLVQLTMKDYIERMK